MHIVSVQGTSLVDYPGNMASVLFTGGCDFRCPNCQNPDLIAVNEQTMRLAEEDVIGFLVQRKSWIDGLVVTGGEPLIHSDLPEFLKRLKEATGQPIKVDTNGHHPDMLQRLIDEGYVDYVAMDIKSDPARYSEAAGKLVDLDRVMRSIAILKEGRVAYEFRTTVVPPFVDETAVQEIGKIIDGAALWAFQQFFNRVTFSADFAGLRPLLPAEVRALAVVGEPYVQRVIVRGV
ncbi:MAG TPA: anaerobic ribonucleoside-triphosphate reductase activating protein [bacterium]|nr:anaerobic ribonucleoside-triphosphate reductase activating protein [bacterium]